MSFAIEVNDKVLPSTLIQVEGLIPILQLLELMKFLFPPRNSLGLGEVQVYPWSFWIEYFTMILGSLTSHFILLRVSQGLCQITIPLSLKLPPPLQKTRSSDLNPIGFSMKNFISSLKNDGMRFLLVVMLTKAEKEK
jgi:hypothetical protein